MITKFILAIGFFVSAIMAAMLAFPMSMSMAMEIAKILFFVFSVLSLGFLILGINQKRCKI